MLDGAPGLAPPRTRRLLWQQRQSNQSAAGALPQTPPRSPLHRRRRRRHNGSRGVFYNATTGKDCPAAVVPRAVGQRSSPAGGEGRKRSNWGALMAYVICTVSPGSQGVFYCGDCQKSSHSDWLGGIFRVHEGIYYFISGSNDSNSGELKKSISVMSNPSQIFLMVEILGSLLLPYKIFFTEDGDMADNVARLLMVMLRSAHNRKMRSLIAVTVSIKIHLLFIQHTRY